MTCSAFSATCVKGEQWLRAVHFFKSFRTRHCFSTSKNVSQAVPLLGWHSSNSSHKLQSMSSGCLSSRCLSHPLLSSKEQCSRQSSTR